MKNYVAYYRVSTKTQERSGLGLDAQRGRWGFHRSGWGRLIQEYTSGERGKTRPGPNLPQPTLRQSAKATSLSQAGPAGRNVLFSPAMESGVDFICCDNPTQPIHDSYSAAVAEWERNKSVTDQGGAGQAKARGVKLARPARPLEGRRMHGCAAPHGRGRGGKGHYAQGDRRVCDLRPGCALHTSG